MADNKLSTNNKERKAKEKAAGLPIVLKGLIGEMEVVFNQVDWLGVVVNETLEPFRTKYVELKVKILRWAIKNNDNDAGKEVFKLLFMPESAGIMFELSLEKYAKKPNLRAELKDILFELSKKILDGLKIGFNKAEELLTNKKKLGYAKAVSV